MWEQPDDDFDDGYDGNYVDDYRNNVKSDIFRHSRKGYVDRDDLYDPNNSDYEYYNSDDEYYNSEDEYYGPEGVNWERLKQEDIFRRRKEGEEAAERSLRYKQYRGPVQYPEMQPQFRERALRRDLQKVQDREASLKSRQRAILEAEKNKLFLKRPSIPKRILTPEAKVRVKDISSENIAFKKEIGYEMPTFIELRKNKYTKILQSLKNEIRIGQQLFRDKNFDGEFNYLFQKYDRAFRFFEIPKAFECGILYIFMEKPLCVITQNEIALTYSSNGWRGVDDKSKDPTTRQRVISIVENKTLKNAIDEWSEISRFFSEDQNMFKEENVQQQYKKRRFEDIITYIRKNIIPKVEKQYKEVKVFDQDSFTRHLIGAFDLNKYGYLRSLICPESKILFQTPMIDIKTGISYEKRYLKTKYSDRVISQNFRVNYKLNELLEFYKNILEKKYLGLQQLQDIDGGGFNF